MFYLKDYNIQQKEEQMEELQAIQGTKRTPPYVDYHAFTVFLDAVRIGLPERVDTKYLEQTKVTKSAHRMLIMALRSLGLIDLDNKPTLLLTSLVKEGDELARNLQELAKTTYADLFTRKEEIELNNKSAVSRYFQETYKISPYTANSCATFFIRLSRDTKLLPGKNERVKVESEPKLKGRDLLNAKIELLRKLPDFKSGWLPQDVQAVLQQFERLLSCLER